MNKCCQIVLKFHKACYEVSVVTFQEFPPAIFDRLVGELIPVVCDELSKLAKDATDEEVVRARAQLKASILMSLESTNARCEQLAQQILIYGRPLPVAEVVGKIEAVGETDVRRLAERLVAGRPTLASLGPIGKVEAFDLVTARFG